MGACHRVLLIAAALPLAACEGCDNPAAPDAPADDDADICGGLGVFLSGEFIDWDSSAAGVTGIAGATWAVRGEPDLVHVTGADGRVELCLPADGMAVIDVAPMGAADYIGGFALADKDVILSGTTYSVRSFKRPRAAELGFAASRAHLYVHVAGGARRVEVSAPSERAYSFDGTDWVPGEDTGTDIYVANIDAGDGQTKLEIPDVIGNPGTVPLEAGRLTFLVVVAR